MTYNLQSLITILEQILNPEQTHWILDEHNKPRLEFLLHKAASLQQILENSPIPTIETLETQIREAAHKAEDTIEAHMVDQKLPRPEGESFTFSPPDLHQLTQEFNSMMEQMVQLMEVKTVSDGSSSLSGASFLLDPSSKTVMVGVDDDLMQLKDRLIGMQSKLEIIPIVGMGGIGKTAVARNLYQDPLIVSHFAWATISQDYNMREVLLGLLHSIIGKDLVSEHIRKEIIIDELKNILYKSLFGRRYMVVLDDMWSTQAWDEMRRYFPDNSNGSRIVITTRESAVAKYVNSQSKQHQMQLLNSSESWNLLQRKVFGDDDCPAALESIGRSIASDCGGLPLAIHVIGGILSKANTTQDVWENVANDVGAAVSEEHEFSKILSLSYNCLPSHLRPCFLYMGAFPEDYVIKASSLIHLWVAEGFLKSSGSKSLEEEAEDCLKALVGRNLVFVRELKSSEKPKSYGIHDLLRDLCLKKAEHQRFLHVKNMQFGNREQDSMYRPRRVSVHPSYGITNILASSTKLMSSPRSFLCIGLASGQIRSPMFFDLRLMKVLDISLIEFKQFPTEILDMVNLRYLAFSFTRCELPPEISRLWNLETLLIRSSHYIICLPFEILQMAELRVKTNHRRSVIIGDVDWRTYLPRGKLQTIHNVANPHPSILHRIPYVRKLGIVDSWRTYDLYHMYELETLKYTGDSERTIVSPSILRLPPSVRKLSLTYCSIHAEFMKYLCRELPDLEVLKLQTCEFVAQEWDAMQQEFSKLQFLLLEYIELVHWKADETNFPRLQRLVLRRCPTLKEIPCGIGEIPTLQTIELDECSHSLVASAQLIIKEQWELGNDDLQLRT